MGTLKYSRTPMPLAEAASQLAGNGDAQFADTAQTLLVLLGNVLAHPTEEKYRKIRLSNPNIQQKVVKPAGAVGVLAAAGFSESEPGFLIFDVATPRETVQAAIHAVQSTAATRGNAQARKDAAARQAYLDEAKAKKAENDRRRAAATGKISGQRREEKTIVDSHAQKRAFGSGKKASAEDCGAGGGGGG